MKSGEGIGIVGGNGGGKCRLMKVIGGMDEYEEGDMGKEKDLRMGYVSEEMRVDRGNTVFEEMGKGFEDVEDVEEEMNDEREWV